MTLKATIYTDEGKQEITTSSPAVIELLAYIYKTTVITRRILADVYAALTQSWADYFADGLLWIDLDYQALRRELRFEGIVLMPYCD